ncbi:MAG TPA: hypothetical protein DCQ99_07750 [Nitrospinae bacterium]|nr:hypothetical protein [Nitrospinota bacterium]HBA25824.1 hypothetical protein [Nitrospinota bacterium]
MPFSPSKKKKRRSRLTVATLTLTSMMDMFTIILLFLLKSYSAEGDILTADPKLKLPVSTSKEPPKMRLILQVTPEDIMVDGVKVAEVGKDMDNKELLIKPLLDKLNENRAKTEFISKSNPSLKFKGEVLIQGNKDIPFFLLEKVMYTSGQAGYSSISLAVISRE